MRADGKTGAARKIGKTMSIGAAMQEGDAFNWFKVRIIMGGLFIVAVCFMSSVDVMAKAAKGAYLEINSSSKHDCNALSVMQ